MKGFSVVVAAAFSLALSLPSASAAERRRHPNSAPTARIPSVEAPETLPASTNGTTLPPYTTWYYFNQLIDHNAPEKGTFVQRYYFTYEFYEPGGPIILMTPGEGSADGYSGYLTNRTINGQIAQANKGATIVLEHRFYGTSNPYPDLSEESFRVHTIDQAVSDFTYFAKNVKLPMPGGDAVTAPNQAPWIWVGGSYSGALTSWILYSQPGVFWSGYASSAVVEAIQYFWGYFEPIRQRAPKNCTADVEKVITHVDTIFTIGTKKQKLELKELFGMSNVTHLDDVAGALRNPIWEWQSLSPTSNGGEFYKFCDALEVKDGVSAPAAGWGLQHALSAFGNYMKSYMSDYCGGVVDDKCAGTYDSSLEYFHDTTVDNSYRSWTWTCCNEVGYWQDGAPLGWPSLVTRLVGPHYDNRQCSYWFPKTFPTEWSANPNVARTNKHFGGWDINIPRLFFANGWSDPWKEATVSSDYHLRQSTANQPIEIANGFHCSDLSTKNGQSEPTIGALQKSAVSYFTKWHQDWHAQKAHDKRAAESSQPAIVIPESIIKAGPASVPASIVNASSTESGSKKTSKHLLSSGWGKKVVDA